MDKVAYYKQEIYKEAKALGGAIGGGIGGGIIGGASGLVQGGILGGLIGGGYNALKDMSPEELEEVSRLEAIRQGSLKGVRTGAKIGGGVGAGLGLIQGGAGGAIAGKGLDEMRKAEEFAKRYGEII